MFRRAAPGIVRIRGLLGFRLAFLVVAVFFGVVYPLIFDIWSRGLFVTWLGVGSFFFLTQSWFGVNLTPAHAVVNSVRWRRIPWSAVQCVTQEHFMGGRRVVLWTADGRRVPLRAPIIDFTGLGARSFDTRFDVIGHWWLDHRGPSWSASYGGG